MTEYDFSEEAYEHYLATHHRVRDWVSTQAEAAPKYSNPLAFTPSEIATRQSNAFYTSTGRQGEASRSGRSVPASRRAPEDSLKAARGTVPIYTSGARTDRGRVEAQPRDHPPVPSHHGHAHKHPQTPYYSAVPSAPHITSAPHVCARTHADQPTAVVVRPHTHPHDHRHPIVFYGHPPEYGHGHTHPLIPRQRESTYVTEIIASPVAKSQHAYTHARAPAKLQNPGSERPVLETGKCSDNERKSHRPSMKRLLSATIPWVKSGRIRQYD